MTCILLINQQLKPLSMEIRHGKSEDNGIKFFGLVGFHVLAAELFLVKSGPI